MCCASRTKTIDSMVAIITSVGPKNYVPVYGPQFSQLLE
jgi:hypothetical protein